MVKETLVYVVNMNESSNGDLGQYSTDEDFIEEAEKQENSIYAFGGGIHTVKGFEKAFNDEEINSDNYFIRFVEVDK